MIDLNKIINEKMVEIEKGGFVEKTIEDNLKKCLENVISDVFSYSGPVRDGIKNHIKENLNINLDDLNIPQYNALVVQAVNKKVKEMIEIQGINKLNECIDKMLIDVKEEYTLSEIIEQLKEDDYKEKYEYSEDDYLTLIIDETAYGYKHIYLDLESDKSKYSCDYEISIDKEGRIYSTQLGSIDITKNAKIGTLFGLNEMIFKIYSSGAKVILDKGMDPDDYNTYLGEDY
ncbi:hypothetical protein HMPREF1092_00899 [Clostridium thermobutyricum]|uniref:Uncharacterized protein n=1 Tax=Clostridium thermobutyricum TaxID=29372 RepID=N9WFL4_9CLOT|nr:hypothetical protein [Clostridium thermobutyricum]ENZ01665.1 hypothetical protein HMPREF1092_00899 [Clostridium thermobutyricum]